MSGNPEEANTFPIKEPFYTFDASGAGDYDASRADHYVEEPIEEPVYAYGASVAGNYDASGAGNYVEEPLEEPVYAYDASGTGDIPGNPEEASTFGNNEQVYGYDVLGNLVQEDFLESVPQEAHTFGMDKQGYDYDALGNLVQEDFLEPMSHETRTFDMDEQGYSYDALGNYDQGDFLQPMPGNTQEASTFGNKEQVYGHDALGNLVHGDFLEPMPQETRTFIMDEHGYGYDALGNYVQGHFLEPMPGNTQEASTVGNNEQVYEGADRRMLRRSTNNDEALNVKFDLIPEMAHRVLSDQNPITKTKQPICCSASMTTAPTGSHTATPVAYTMSEIKGSSTTSAPMGSPTATSSAYTTSAIKGNSTSGESSTTGYYTVRTLDSNPTVKLQAWKNGNAAIWNRDCDFPNMGDYRQEYNTKGEQCDPLCGQDPQCTHFTYNKGTCFLKEGGAFKQDAKDLVPSTGIVCGIKKLYKPNVVRSRWMSNLPDRSELKDLVIPGTHNSVAGPQSDPILAPFSQCQQDDVRSQLYRGVRYFDLRLAECEPKHYDLFAGDKSLCFWHGRDDWTGDYLDLSLEKVAWEFYWFLQNNPREVIVAKIAIEYGHPKVDPNTFLQRVEKYFEGHHEWWVHPGVEANYANTNIRLYNIRGRIVVLWDCKGCGSSKYGLSYGMVDNEEGPNGDGSYDNFEQKFRDFLDRAKRVANSFITPGWFENSAAWTDYDDLGIPYPPLDVAQHTNPKIQELLLGKYGSQLAQKGLIPADYITDAMIGTMIDITHSRQERYTVDLNFFG
jgi:hypothetical protein